MSLATELREVRPSLSIARLQGALLGRQVGAGHEPCSELGDLSAFTGNFRVVACPDDQVVDESQRALEPERVG